MIHMMRRIHIHFHIHRIHIMRICIHIWLKHTKNHSNMCHHKKYTNPNCMPFLAIFFITFWKPKMCKHNTNERNNTKKIKSNSDNINHSTPSSWSSNRDNCWKKQIHKHTNEIYTTHYSCNFTESFYFSGIFSSK